MVIINIGWRLLTHGAIHGHRQMMTYLQCNNNDLVATALRLFVDVISIHGLPSIVREDFGVEKADIARFLLDCPERGIHRGSFIIGTFEVLG